MAKYTVLMPAAASAFANIFFGMTVVATRYLVAEVDPLTLAFLRNLIAAITLLPLLARSSPITMERRDVLPVAALGAAQFGVFPLTFTISLDYTLASRGALVFALVPILTLVFAALLRVEPFTRFKGAGALLALTGVLLGVGNRMLGLGKDDGMTGEVFMFITVLIGASYNVFSRSYLRRYRARVLTVYFMGAGVLLLAPFALVGIAANGLPSFDLWQWLLLIFTGTFGGSIGYFLFIWALEKGTPARVAVFVPLNPIAATLLGTALLGESISGWFLAGLLCVMVGIVLANTGGDPARPPPVPEGPAA